MIFPSQMTPKRRMIGIPHMRAHSNLPGWETRKRARRLRPGGARRRLGHEAEVRRGQEALAALAVPFASQLHNASVAGRMAQVRPLTRTTLPLWESREAALVAKRDEALRHGIPRWLHLELQAFGAAVGVLLGVLGVILGTAPR